MCGLWKHAEKKMKKHNLRVKIDRTTIELRKIEVLNKIHISYNFFKNCIMTRNSLPDNGQS